MRTAASGAQNAGAILRASDYTPPAGFVETMERPSPYPKQRNTVTFSESKDGYGNVLEELWKI